MTPSGATTSAFVREHLRARLTLVLLIGIPSGFVAASASVLGDFSGALGGSLAGRSATALSAGWAAGFVSGAVGFFQVSSSRGTDRCLALAGLGAHRVAIARITAAAALAGLATLAAFGALLVRQPVAHPLHALAGIAFFSFVYLGIGAVVGSVVTDPLEGSLMVVVVFLLDAFSVPAMTSAGGLAGGLAPTRWAADVLVAAGVGASSDAPRDWIRAAVSVAAALAVAAIVFRRAVQVGR